MIGDYILEAMKEIGDMENTVSEACMAAYPNVNDVPKNTYEEVLNFFFLCAATLHSTLEHRMAYLVKRGMVDPKSPKYEYIEAHFADAFSDVDGEKDDGPDFSSALSDPIIAAIRMNSMRKQLDTVLRVLGVDKCV